MKTPQLLTLDNDPVIFAVPAAPGFSTVCLSWAGDRVTGFNKTTVLAWLITQDGCTYPQTIGGAADWNDAMLAPDGTVSTADGITFRSAQHWFEEAKAAALEREAKAMAKAKARADAEQGAKQG